MTAADPTDLQQRETLSNLRDAFDSLCHDHASSLSADAVGLAEEAIERAKREAAAEAEGRLQRLAAGIRKIRSAAEPVAVLNALVDSAPAHRAKAVLLVLDGDRLVGFRAAGTGDVPDGGRTKEISVEIASAPALAHAIDSRDTVITEGGAHSLSKRLAAALAFREGKVRVHPVVLRDTVLGLLLVEGAVEPAAVIESLVSMAEAWIEALGSRQEGAEAADA